MLIGSSLISTILGLVGILFGLSILVQVIQECWKYLLSTKSGAYQRALFVFLGPWSEELLRPGLIPDLQVNGPLQKWRSRPRGRLQPMDQQTLVTALERTAAPWVQRVLEALRAEAALQKGHTDALSPAFERIVEQLEMTVKEPSSPGYSTALEALRFLKRWSAAVPASHSDIPVNASKLIAAFRQEFLPQIVQVETSFGQLQRNFDYLYRRRNMALTVLFAIAVALALDAPIASLYRQARGMTIEQALALAQDARSVYDSLSARLPQSSTPARQADSLEADRYRQLSRDILTSLRQSSSMGPGADVQPDFISTRAGELGHQLTDGGFLGALSYVLGILATALLISFGAPFWNDVAGAILRVSQGSRKVEIAPAKNGGDG